MAEKNFARSGTGNADLLPDDDPLSELARLVGYEDRPYGDRPAPARQIEPVTEAYAAPEPRESPVLALEDELMRAFEIYEAPSRGEIVHAEPAPEVVPERDVVRQAPPFFAESEPLVEDYAEVDAATLPLEPAFEAQEPALDDLREPAFDLPQEATFHDVQDDWAPVEPVAEVLPEPEVDPYLSLAEEAEAAAYVAPAVDAEPAFEAQQTHSAEYRQEPQFDAPAYEPAHASEPVFLGLQPADAHDDPLSEVKIDLERELELSIGDGFDQDVGIEAIREEPAYAEASPVFEAAYEQPLPEVTGTQDVAASFAEPVVSADASAEAHVDLDTDGWLDAAQEVASEPFRAEVAYEEAEPHFVETLPFEDTREHERAMAEAEARWQAEPVESFVAEPAYDVASVAKGDDYDHDLLLAEVEQYPVPEARSSLADIMPVAMRQHTPANVAAIFGRATPVASREPAKAEPVIEEIPEASVFETPVFETSAPVEAAASDPEIDFENFELDLSDIELELDPAEFSLEDEPVAAVAEQPVTQREEALVHHEQPQARREQASVAVPVSVYTASKQAAPAPDAELPFDPTLIADTDQGVTAVAELEVPQLPVIEKEQPAAYQSDFDLDIDAEMAQLFNAPAEKAPADDLKAGVSAEAVAASLHKPGAAVSDFDDFERAIEEDFHQSLGRSERMAIPVEPGQGNAAYAGDGYDDERTGRSKGMLIAASVAALVLLGGGGVYAWSLFSGGTAGSGEPRVILADKDPVKIVPDERGGKTVPNQDKAVYDRVAGNTNATPQQEQLVTTTEEPIDVVQRTLTPETLPFDGEPETIAEAEEAGRILPGVDDAAETQVGDGTPVVSPRRVKTMIVKPDGTMVEREIEAPATQVAAAETSRIGAEASATTGGVAAEAAATLNEAVAEPAADADVSLRAEQAATNGQPRSVLAEVADASVEETAPVRTVRTTTFGANGATADNAAAESNMPVPEMRPVDQPVTVVGTVTERGNVAGTETARASETATATTTETSGEVQVAAANPGGYVIQIASLPSEAEAQRSYNSLSSRFANVIGGRGVDIRKAEIANRGTYYRVRIPAGSREEANALCERYKSAGGSCLVTR